MKRPRLVLVNSSDPKRISLFSAKNALAIKIAFLEIADGTVTRSFPPQRGGSCVLRHAVSFEHEVVRVVRGGSDNKKTDWGKCKGE